MKKFVLFIFMLFSISTFGQTTVDAQEINAIKKDQTYLWGENRSADLGEALAGARTSLEIRVSEWVKEQHASEGIEVCIVKAKENCSEIQTMMGNRYRALIYVKKSDILPVADKSEVKVVKVIKDEPKQEPVVEKPLVIIQKTIQEPNPQPIIERKEETTYKPRPDVRLTPDERKMVSIANKKDLETYLKAIDGIGKIKKYGKLNDLPQNANCYIFIYDKQDNVPAVLKKVDSTMVNLKELREDSFKNYENCGLVWIQLR